MWIFNSNNHSLIPNTFEYSRKDKLYRLIKTEAHTVQDIWYGYIITIYEPNVSLLGDYNCSIRTYKSQFRNGDIEQEDIDIFTCNDINSKFLNEFYEICKYLFDNNIIF